MNKTLVVVPTYNERENLPPLTQRLLALPTPVDMLVVDDNSPDGTGKIADELAVKHPSIHVLHRNEKNGLGRAYIAGFNWALEHGYEFVFELDGDFSHNPDDIPMFLEAAQNADLVLGSRYLNGIRIINWPLSRLMLSKSAAKYVQIITGMPFTDPTGGYVVNGFDNASRKTSAKRYASGGALLTHMTYAYDSTGRVNAVRKKAVTGGADGLFAPTAKPIYKPLLLFC